MTAEYATLVVYMAILLVLGASLARFNKNLSDFVRGGAQGTWWLVGTSIFMAGISAFTFTGNASAAYDGGASMLILYVANCCGFAVGGLFLGPWLRQTRAFTPIDTVRARFGTPVEQLSAFIGVFLGPISAAIQLYALALFASTTLELPLLPVLFVIAVIVTFYSTTGGRWAVMATDFVQATVVMAITLLVCFLSLKEIGGIAAFFEHYNSPRLGRDFELIKEPGAFPGDRFTLKWAVIVFFMQINAQISLTAAGRYITARDGREASRAAWWGMALMALGSLIWFVPPMVARFLFEAEITASGVEKASESSYAFIAMRLLPNGLVGMLIAAMFAATMSSMDSGLNNQVGVVVRNIIPRIRGVFGYHAELAPKAEMRICHISTLFFGFLITTYAVLFSKQKELALFDAFLLIGSVIAIPMGFPNLVGLWIKTLPKWSYFPILFACLMPSIWSFIDKLVYGNSWTIQDRTLWIFIFGIFATFACWLLRDMSSNKSKREVHEFFKMMHTPVDFDKEIGASPIDYEQYFILGKAIMLIGALILLVILMPNSTFHRFCIVGVSSFLIAVGALLYFQGKRIKKIYLEKYPDKVID